LPKVLAFNAPCCESQLGRVAEAMGVMPDAGNAIQAVAALSAEVGIPARLSEVGVTEQFIPQMAQDAYSSGNAQVVNPRKPSLADVTALYQQSL
ncbi:MAG TPA: iron-containing alcohol dehydrogenase, partial [Anaerolineales bacterium]|nr:iron-containing alcohol dehydrogenase [Anaerolineales bacterium]